MLLPAGEATGAFIRTQAPFPVANNHFFGRAWLRVGPDVPETHSNTHAPTVVEHGGLKKFGYDMPGAQWLCVEWEYDGSNKAAPPEFAQLEIGWHTYQKASSRC